MLKQHSCLDPVQKPGFRTEPRFAESFGCFAFATGAEYCHQQAVRLCICGVFPALCCWGVCLLCMSVVTFLSACGFTPSLSPIVEGGRRAGVVLQGVVCRFIPSRDGREIFRTVVLRPTPALLPAGIASSPAMAWTAESTRCARPRAVQNACLCPIPD